MQNQPKKYRVAYLENGVRKEKDFTEAENISFYQQMRTGEPELSVISTSRI